MAVTPFATKAAGERLRASSSRSGPIHGRTRRTTAMKKPVYVFVLVVAAFFLLSTPASAGVLYDNGLVNGEDYWGIYYADVVSDSFTLAGTSTLTGVNLGISIAASDIPEYLYW